MFVSEKCYRKKGEIIRASIRAMVKKAIQKNIREPSKYKKGVDKKPELYNFLKFIVLNKVRSIIQFI